MKNEEEQIGNINSGQALAAYLSHALYSHEATTEQRIVATGILMGSLMALHKVDILDVIALLGQCHELAQKFFEREGTLQ